MVKPLVEIHTYSIRKDDESSSLITIEPPAIDPKSGDYFCRVVAIGPNGFRLDAYGGSASQAVMFALQMAALKIGTILSSAIIDASAETDPS